MDDLTNVQLDRLTAEMAWMTRLARALVHDPSTADDIAQDTFLAAAGHVPDEDDRPLRPWLSRVMRNVVRMRHRSARRREQRELRDAARDVVEPVPTAAELVDRVELQRKLASEVLALAEPYRELVLLQFFEGLSSADIARRLELPEGTVRRRMKTALDQLRARFASDDRAQPALALLAVVPHRRAARISQLATRWTMKKLIAGVILVVLLVVGAVWTYKRRGGGDDSPSAATAAANGASGAAGVAAVADGNARRAWFVQPGVAPRRIAGHVLYDGAPLGGATVRLEAIAGDDPRFGPRTGDEVANVKSQPDGSFDFGPQPAASYAVSAESADKTPAGLVIEAADPSAKTERLVLGLTGCRTRVYGSVVDSSGGGVARARLRVVGLGGTLAGPSGEYSLCLPLDSVVRVEADGYGAVEVPIHLVGKMRHDFELVPESVVQGRVVDDTGHALAFAHVIAIPQAIEQPHNLGAGWTTADADGRFRIAKLAPGRFLLAARGEGFSTSTPQPAIAATGSSAPDVTLVVTRHAKIAGHVVMSGAPVAGACVGVPKLALGPKCAYSQPDGSFVLDGVPFGKQKLDAAPYRVQAPKLFTVDKVALDDVTVEVSELAALRGIVTRHKQPIAEAIVQTTIGPTATSDATGAYELRGLPAGKVQLFAQVSGATNAFMPLAQVTLTEGQTTTFDIDLTGGAEVHGTVVDEAGKPVPNVYVRLIDGTGDIGESMTDDKGGFAAASMKGSGDYRVSVFPSPGARVAFQPASGTTYEAFHLGDGDTILKDVRVAIAHEEMSIAGRVVDDTGAPIADVHVEAIGTAHSQGIGMMPSIRADADGKFVIGSLARGAYTLHAHAGDGSEVEVQNVAAGTTNVELRLVRPGAIEGTIAGFTTQPRVHARQMTNTLALDNEAVISGQSFSITGLAPGKYIVEAITGDENDGQSIDVKAGQTYKVALKSRGRGVVQGTVVEFATHKPVPQMNCWATQSLGGQAGDLGQQTVPNAANETDAAGAFKISAPIGKARVVCFSQDNSYSVAGGDVDVTPSAPGTVELVAVKIQPPPCDPGFRIKPLTLPLVIAAVDPAGPAAKSGLQIGDRVTSLDGQPATGLLPNAAMNVAWNHRAGSTLVLGIDRNGTPATLKITVAAASN